MVEVLTRRRGSRLSLGTRSVLEPGKDKATEALAPSPRLSWIPMPGARSIGPMGSVGPRIGVYSLLCGYIAMMNTEV